MAIAGICPCGGHLKELAHTVKTLRSAREWEPELTAAELPVRIERKVCTACGRDEVMRIRCQVKCDERAVTTLGELEW